MGDGQESNLQLVTLNPVIFGERLQIGTMELIGTESPPKTYAGSSSALRAKKTTIAQKHPAKLSKKIHPYRVPIELKTVEDQDLATTLAFSRPLGRHNTLDRISRPCERGCNS
jgi:hypothetical protein